jgi:hypothetical protein
VAQFTFFEPEHQLRNVMYFLRAPLHVLNAKPELCRFARPRAPASKRVRISKRTTP